MCMGFALETSGEELEETGMAPPKVRPTALCAVAAWSAKGCVSVRNGELDDDNDEDVELVTTGCLSTLNL